MMDVRARLRPMGIGDILDETFRLYRENFLLFLATVAVVEVPLQIVIIALTLGLAGSAQTLSTISTTTTSGEPLTSEQRDALVRAGTSAAGLGSIIFIISIIGLALLSTALAVVIARRYLGQPVTVGEAYRASLGRLGAFVVAVLWIGVRVGLLFITIIGIPVAIYFIVAWTLYPQTIVLEGTGGGAASRRSRELITGFWWKTAGLLIVTQLLVSVVAAIPTGIVGAIVGSAVGTLYARTLVNGVIGLIVGLLLRPIQATATTLLFYDLKIRKEAFDLEAMARQAGVPLPPGQAGQPYQPGPAYGQPAQSYGQQGQAYGQPYQPGYPYGQQNQPTQPYQPGQPFGQPAQPYQPDQRYGQPGQPYQSFGQPDQPYGQPDQSDQPYGQQGQPYQQGQQDQPGQPRRPDQP